MTKQYGGIRATRADVGSQSIQYHTISRSDGLLVWFDRMLLLVLLGYLYRPPFPRFKKVVLALLSLVLFTAFAQSSHGVSDNLSDWLPCFVPAPFIINYLHQQRALHRRLSIGTCIFVVGILWLCSPAAFRKAVPFFGFNWITFLVFFTVFVAVLFKSRKFLPSAEVCIAIFIENVRTIREALEEPENTVQQVNEQVGVQNLAKRTSKVIPEQERNNGFEYVSWRTGLEYEDLVGEQIRLLELLPPSNSGGDAAAELECRLTTTTLSDADNAYTCLSYHWGSDQQKRRITINGFPVHIPINLYKALIDVRAYDGGPLWIDALCINQENDTELGTQVLMMGSIFQRARLVLAWLGVMDNPSHRIMNLLKARAIPAQQATYPPIDTTFPQANGPGFEDLSIFVDRPYWRRVWIIQELAAASNVDLVCCGERVSLKWLSELVETTLKCELDNQLHDWPKFAGNLQLIKNIIDIRKQSFSGSGMHLLEVLLKTKVSQASKVHDKVFGLLGLATDKASFMRWAPSYGESTDDMSMKMTKSFILQRKKLDIILAGTRKISGSELPSWCPDYFNVCAAAPSEHFVRYICGNDNRRRLGGPPSQYWTTTQSSEAIEDETFRIDNKSLHLNGIRIGVIHDVCTTSERGAQSEIRAFGRSSTLVEGQGKQTKPDKSDYSVYDGICRMLMLYSDKYAQFTNAPLILGMLYAVAYDIYAAARGGKAELVLQWLNSVRYLTIQGKTVKWRALRSGGRITGNWVKAMFKSNTDVMTVFDYGHVTEAVANILEEGLHLISLRERRVGWAHPDADLGDEVFMLAGCSLPVVLRKNVGKTTYQVIGHAYIDEHMDGEIWDKTTTRTWVEVE